MPDRHRIYESFVRLYPREFRHEYGDDLVQHFTDLVHDRGTRAAWTRASLDLAITIPRHNLEHLMADRRTTATLSVAMVLLAAAGLATMIVGALPGMIFLIAAAVLIITQRSALARAMRVPDSDRRRNRLRAAAILGAIFVTTFGAYLLTVGDTWTLRDTVLSLVGTPALVWRHGLPRRWAPHPTDTPPGPLRRSRLIQSC